MCLKIGTPHVKADYDTFPGKGFCIVRNFDFWHPYSNTIILWHQQNWIKWLSVFWAFKIVAVNPRTHCTLSPTTNKQTKHPCCSHNIGILGKKESSSSRLRVMTQLSLVVCVFPFKYSLAALLENDYLQNTLQMIFKFQKEFCTLWSTVKNIYIFIIHC